MNESRAEAMSESRAESMNESRAEWWFLHRFSPLYYAICPRLCHLLCNPYSIQPSTLLY